MQNNLPYEQHIKEQGNNMPVPDIDMAWHEMELLLDKKDDDAVIIPWYKRIGCMLPALLLFVGLIIGSIFYFVNKKDVVKNDIVKKDENVSGNKNEKTSTIISEKQNDTSENINSDTAKIVTNNDIAAKENNVQLNEEKIFEQNKNNFNSKGKTKTTITGAEIAEDNILTNETIRTKNKVDNKLNLAKVNRTENAQKQKEKIKNINGNIVEKESFEKAKNKIKLDKKTKTKITNVLPDEEIIANNPNNMKQYVKEPVSTSETNNVNETAAIKTEETIIKNT